MRIRFDRTVVVYILAILFADYIPLLGEDSIQFGCGPEAQARRRLHDRSFSHDAVVKKISLFEQVSSTREKYTTWSQ